MPPPANRHALACVAIFISTFLCRLATVTGFYFVFFCKLCLIAIGTINFSTPVHTILLTSRGSSSSGNVGCGSIVAAVRLIVYDGLGHTGNEKPAGHIG